MRLSCLTLLEEGGIAGAHIIVIVKSIAVGATIHMRESSLQEKLEELILVSCRSLSILTLVREREHSPCIPSQCKVTLLLCLQL